MKKLIFFIFFLTILTVSVVHSMQDIFQSKEDAWDPKGYEEHFESDLQDYSNIFGEEQIPQNATVVDFGCKTGNAAAYIANNIVPLGRVIGFDINRKMIDYAKIKHDAISNLEFKYNFFDVLAANSVDYVVSNFYLNWIKDFDQIQAVMKEVVRCLKPGGQFIAGFPIKHTKTRFIPILRALDEVIVEGRWSIFYQNTVPFVNNLDAQDYFQAMFDVGLHGSVSVSELPAIASSRERLESDFLHLPTGRMIPEQCRHKFFGDFFEKLEQQYVRKNSNGDFILTRNPCVIRAFKKI